jgi:proteic killer suppression protein
MQDVLITRVRLTRKALKDLKSVPYFIIYKFEVWSSLVEMRGLEEVRKISEFHDEPLKGKRTGQRSIRLNKSYRAIYIIVENEISFIEVI